MKLIINHKIFRLVLKGSRNLEEDYVALRWIDQGRVKRRRKGSRKFTEFVSM